MLAGKEYKNWKQKRQYETGAIDYPKGWMWMDLPKFADYYPKETVKKFIQSAERYKLDPNDLLALGVAESGLGMKHPDNPLRINYDAHDKEMRKRYPALQEVRDIGDAPGIRDIVIDYGTELLADSFKKYKDRISALQAYSGTGSTLYGGPKRWAMTPGGISGEEKFFGKPIKETDFWKEKPQGKRVNEISIWLRKNEELQQMINEVWK